MSRWVLVGTVLLCGLPSSAQQNGTFSGQLGALDPSMLGEGWSGLRPSEMPAVPLEGATVSIVDCEEDCPQPVMTDAAGWFEFPGIAAETLRLRFDPPACADDDPECEPLEPREETLANGSRTVLGAKWPAGVEDTVLRYLPSVAGAIYIKREGEIPGLPGAGGAAGRRAVWVNGLRGWDEFREYRTFVHELMHLYEFRLRDACWRHRRDVNGWILQEDWLRAYEADRRYREENDLPLRDPTTYNLDERSRAMETLAWFAEDYFTPEALMLEWPYYGTYCDSTGCRPSKPGQHKTYRELEVYAPHRYAYFERIVFERYLDEKQWRRNNPDGGEWPGMCEAPVFDGDEDDSDRSNSGGGVVWPFGSKSSSGPPSLSYSPEDPGPTICSFPEHR
jgi:hypothetical protein